VHHNHHDRTADLKTKSGPASTKMDYIGHLVWSRSGEDLEEPTSQTRPGGRSTTKKANPPPLELIHWNIDPISTLQTTAAYVDDRSTDVMQVSSGESNSKTRQGKVERGVDRLIHQRRPTPTARGDFSAGRTVPTPSNPTRTQESTHRDAKE
jgi:hypothetical protein